MYKTSYESWHQAPVSISSNKHTLKSLTSLSNKNLLQLFTPPQREIFQLDYLESSQHAQHYPQYIEILNILRHYNETSSALMKHPNINREQHLFVRYSMKFLYKEMLSISVMNHQQIKNNNYALKLRTWYQQLNNKHTFLDGVSFKKHYKIQKDSDIQRMIRESYMSNVYEEIDEYQRKKFVYLQDRYNDSVHVTAAGGSQPNKDNNRLSESSSGNNQKQKINLPLIDVGLYNREYYGLKMNREKAFEKGYIDGLFKKSNKLRETQMKNIKQILQRKESMGQMQKEFRKKKNFRVTQMNDQHDRSFKENSNFYCTEVQLRSNLNHTQQNLKEKEDFKSISQKTNKILSQQVAIKEESVEQIQKQPSQKSTILMNLSFYKSGQHFRPIRDFKKMDLETNKLITNVNGINLMNLTLPSVKGN